MRIKKRAKNKGDSIYIFVNILRKWSFWLNYVSNPFRRAAFWEKIAHVQT